MRKVKHDKKKYFKGMIIFLIFVFSFILFPPFLYPRSFYESPKKNEVVIIGLEGATWKVIKTMIEKNELPNFKFLLDNGAHGSVNSSVFSNQVWNNIAKDKLKKGKNIWGVASEKNKTVLSLYWQDNNRSEIHDFKGFLLLSNPISEFLKKLYYFKILIPTSKADKDLVYDFYLLDHKMREFFYSREKLKPDLSGIVFSGLSRLQLYFWMYREPERFQNVSKDEIEKYGKVIEQYYIEFDHYIGKLIEEKNVTIIILSGYGFDATIPQKIIDKILVNKMLEIDGLLSFDYTGEIDFSKTKAYSLEEGLEEMTIIYINARNEKESEAIKTQVFNLFSSVYIKETSKPVFKVSKSDKYVVLRRNVPTRIADVNIVILNRKFPIDDFILRRIISGRTTEEGILIMYGNQIKKEEIHVKTINDIAPLIIKLLNNE